MPEASVLVTGGAGYIGSHCIRRLSEAGFSVVVVDNLYSGHRWAIPEGMPFFEGNAGDQKLVGEVIREYKISAVLHFAGHIVAPESVDDPLKYYANNTGVSRDLIQTCVTEGVENFIFSSTAAVYGQPEIVPVIETAPLCPINPYGSSKLVTEWVLRDTAASAKTGQGPAAAKAPNFRYVALRYFNVAGARPDGSIGQATPAATHLIKIASEASCGLRPGVSIFGTDYPTRDGTCIRDYIHVEDLCEAHILALRHLLRGGEPRTFNVGYGGGFTVREVLAAMQEVTGIRLKVQESGRRSGDPVALVADSTAIQRSLGWTHRYNDIKVICETAYRWERSRHK
ncbi:MAG: UDP-glucose 4-epimerase GalE [Burkholderiales bacterium]